MIIFMASLVSLASVALTMAIEIPEHCQGIHLFKQGHVQQAMPVLFQRVKEFPQDWISMEYIGAGFSMTARRLAALPIQKQTSAVVEQEQQALQGAAFYFAQAFRIKKKEDTSAVGGECLSYAEPPHQSLRAWGDALAWLGKPNQAADVFSSPEARRLWPDQHCRPIYQFAVRPAGTRHFIYNESLTRLIFSHVRQPVVKYLLPLLRRHPSLYNMAATSSFESAGLHKGQTWSTVIFWADGHYGSACADDLRMKTTQQKPWHNVCQAIKNLMNRVPALNLIRGQIKLSRMSPGTIVRPHAGPTNGRLRMHCSVDVPETPLDNGNNSEMRMRIRVGGRDEMWRSWSSTPKRGGSVEIEEEEQEEEEEENAACFVFREECEHEVFIGRKVSRARTVLIVDFANPFLDGFDVYKKIITMKGGEYKHAIAEEGNFLENIELLTNEL